MRHVLGWIALSLLVVAGAASAAGAGPAPVATYLFADTLAAREPDVAPLTSVDPLGLNRFETATVFGTPRRVFVFDGTTAPTEQAGLTLGIGGLVDPASYSVELVMRFDGTSGYRRILDVQDRASDNGFYVDPSDRLNVYPVGSGSASFTNGAFRHVVLTVHAAEVKAYLDGVPQFTLGTAVMNVVNARNVVSFFLDNNAGSAQGEYSDGRIALLRLYPGALADADVTALAADPFPADELPGRFTASIACPTTGRAGTMVDATVTFRNPTKATRTVTHAAVGLHAGELTALGTRSVPLAVAVPHAAAGSPGVATATVPVLLQGRRGAFVSVGLAFLGRVGAGPARRTLASGGCLIEIVR